MQIGRLGKFCIGILIGLFLWVAGVSAGTHAALPSQAEASSAVAATATTFPPYLAAPLNVGVAMTIDKIKGIDEEKGTFSADIALLLRWKDPELSFDPVKEGTDRKLFSGAVAESFLSKIWLPGVEISNMSGQPDRKSSGVYICPNGEVAYNQNISADFKHRFALQNFPFDVQHLPISLV